MSDTEAVQVLPVKLLPGVPVTPVLGPEHPFHTGPVLDNLGEDALLEPGSALPPFSVRAADAYGNTCVPSASLSWSVELHCDAVTPCPGVAAPDGGGAAALQNVQVAHGVKKAADWGVVAELRVFAAAAAEGLAAAVAAAEAVPLSGLRLLVAPSRAPTAMTVILDESELPFEMVDGADGEPRRTFQVLHPCSWTHMPTNINLAAIVAVTSAYLCRVPHQAELRHHHGRCTTCEEQIHKIIFIASALARWPSTARIMSAARFCVCAVVRRAALHDTDEAGRCRRSCMHGVLIQPSTPAAIPQGLFPGSVGHWAASALSVLFFVRLWCNARARSVGHCGGALVSGGL